MCSPPRASCTARTARRSRRRGGARLVRVRVRVGVRVRVRVSVRVRVRVRVRGARGGEPARAGNGVEQLGEPAGYRAWHAQLEQRSACRARSLLQLQTRLHDDGCGRRGTTHAGRRRCLGGVWWPRWRASHRRRSRWLQSRRLRWPRLRSRWLWWPWLAMTGRCGLSGSVVGHLRKRKARRLLLWIGLPSALHLVSARKGSHPFLLEAHRR